MRGKHRIHTDTKRYQKVNDSCCALAAAGLQSIRVVGMRMRIQEFVAIGALMVAGCASRPLRDTSASGSKGKSRYRRPPALQTVKPKRAKRCESVLSARGQRLR